MDLGRIQAGDPLQDQFGFGSPDLHLFVVERNDLNCGRCHIVNHLFLALVT